MLKTGVIAVASSRLFREALSAFHQQPLSFEIASFRHLILEDCWLHRCTCLRLASQATLRHVAASVADHRAGPRHGRLSFKPAPCYTVSVWQVEVLCATQQEAACAASSRAASVLQTPACGCLDQLETCHCFHISAIWNRKTAWCSPQYALS